MFGVVEHLKPARPAELCVECRRVLAPKRMIILTTPGACSDRSDLPSPKL